MAQTDLDLEVRDGATEAGEVERVREELERRASQPHLRVVFVGSVDDGKSTLIGRILYDSESLPEDVLAQLESEPRLEDGGIDLSLLTDGLAAEREQGITIDVAYRYFSTSKRSFVCADAPGHVQYTRNMVTGAADAQVAIVLVDATEGPTQQTKRHLFIASLVRVPRIVIAVNKMDGVDYDEERFESLEREILDYCRPLGFSGVRVVPVSALRGDNVVLPSEKMRWYSGPTLLGHLEEVYTGTEDNLIDFRLPVQLVQRAKGGFRGYSGQIASGRIRVGEPVIVLPGGVETRVASIQGPRGELEEATVGNSVVVSLTDDVDCARGSVLARPQNVPEVVRRFESMLVWIDEEAFDPEQTYLARFGPQEVSVDIERLTYRIDIETLHREAPAPLRLNEIGRVGFRARQPVCVDAYEQNRRLGAFVLIDPVSARTVAAGMVIRRRHASELDLAVETDSSSSENFARPRTLWFTGLSGAGKSTLADALATRLRREGVSCVRLDGDELRRGVMADLGFSRPDRRENIRRVAELARLLTDQGHVVLVSLISPYAEERARAREIVGADRFCEIHVEADLEICEERDPKGLYARARRGEIAAFTGVDDDYETPESPDVRLSTSRRSVNDCIDALWNSERAR